MKTNKRIRINKFLIAVFILFVGMILFIRNVHASYENIVYFKNLVVDANNSGLVYAEIVAVGQSGDKITTILQAIKDYGELDENNPS